MAVSAALDVPLWAKHNRVNKLVDLLYYVLARYAYREKYDVYKDCPCLLQVFAYRVAFRNYLGIDQTFMGEGIRSSKIYM